VSERTATVAAAAVLLAHACALGAAEPQITDPTLAPYIGARSETPVGGDSPLLKATNVSKDSRSAVIGDRVVMIGSIVDGAEVVAIEAGRVDLRRGTQVTSLELRLPPVKRRSAAGERP